MDPVTASAYLLGASMIYGSAKDQYLTPGVISQGQIVPWNNGNDRVPHSPRSSPSDCFTLNTRYDVGYLTHLQRCNQCILPPYPTAVPTKRDKFKCVLGDMFKFLLPVQNGLIRIILKSFWRLMLWAVLNFTPHKTAAVRLPTTHYE